MAAAAAAADAPRESYTLRSLEEFRFEVEAQATATITLTSGSAEIFGAEMVTNKAYSFSGTQQAVFSWEGCTLEVEGSAGHCYVAAETPMTSYLQLQGELQSMRDLAESSGGQGPCVLVAGPADTGKSSLSRLLANYLAQVAGAAPAAKIPSNATCSGARKRESSTSAAIKKSQTTLSVSFGRITSRV